MTKYPKKFSQFKTENSERQKDKSVPYADTFTALGLGLWITEGGKVKESKKAGSSIWLNVGKGLALKWHGNPIPHLVTTGTASFQCHGFRFHK